MSILSISNLTQSFGDFDVFTGLTAAIPNDGKVGMVGPNGIGKTTLLRILAGLDQPSGGSINLAQGTRVGYLRQEAMEAFAEKTNTVYNEMLTVFAPLREQEARLNLLQERMSAGEADEALLTEYGTLHDSFEHAGGYDYEVRIVQTLEGLGFGKEDYALPLRQLSGGQKTRALLARLLLEQPDLIILDEPTNHLDVEAIEWLETTLHNWPGAILIVSHDRYFLDRVVNRIWEMSRSGVEEYRGNYTAYLQQRQERWERRALVFDTIKEKFLSELDFIKRNIARDSTRDRAKGRLKRLIREVRVVEQGGLEILLSKNWGEVMDEVSISSSDWGVADAEQAIKGLQSPVQRPPKLNLHLKSSLRSGNIVLRTSKMTIGYPGNTLFTTDSIELFRGECAALIGPNGTGKTTFLRTLMQQIEPLAGEVRFGASLKIGYFTQAQERMNPNNTVLQELIDFKFMLLGQARSYLAQYLFRGEDVYKPIHLLSGGERGRLALALLALQDANFLLLDEPTNHLDIPAQEMLQQTMEAFSGTVLLVSHDRYLIDRQATQIWELRNGRLHVFEGDYVAFVADKERGIEQSRQLASQQRAESKRDQSTDRRSKNETRKRQQSLAALEQEVHQLEQKLAQVGDNLQRASEGAEVTKIQQLSTTYAETQHALEAAMERWAALAEE